MSRFLVSALLLFLWTAGLPAVTSHAQSALASKQDDNSPIEIVSDRMRSHNKGQKIVFSGNVEAKWGDLTIKSDILEVYNNSKKDKGGSKPSGEGKQQLDEVIAIGNVDITRAERRAKGDRAVYLDKLQRIILTGKPHATAWDGDNIIKGREMIFHLEDDRFTVNDRVRVTLYPEDEETKNPKKINSAPEKLSTVKGLKGIHLAKAYRKRKVVNEVSIEVHEGEIVGLLGPNGAGKTTTFYMVVGLTRPDSGQVLLDDKDITAFPMYLRARQGISYLPQEPSVFRKLTVEENLLAVLESQKIPKFESKKRARALLREFNILHIKNAKTFTLSGGERRRVEISRALATSPRFVLLDEPFAGIDPIAVADIQSIVQQLKKRGIGVLITDHNVRETLSITDRAYIISEGQIIASGLPYDVAQDEKVKQIYLGEQFSL